MALENSGEVLSVLAELPVSLIQSRIVYLDIMSVAIKADLFHLEKNVENSSKPRDGKTELLHRIQSCVAYLDLTSSAIKVDFLRWEKNTWKIHEWMLSGFIWTREILESPRN